MKHIYSLIFVICLCIFAPIARGQSTTLSSGGQAQGTSGNISYSIGQSVYQSYTGNNHTISEGVQQPYEISIIASSKESLAFSLGLSVFPNPTIDKLVLSAEASQQTELNYYLFKLDGKLLLQGTLINSVTMDLSNFPTGTYLLNVTNSTKTIQSFKVIKN